MYLCSRALQCLYPGGLLMATQSLEKMFRGWRDDLWRHMQGGREVMNDIP